MKFLKNRFDLISLCFLASLGPLFVFPRENWNWVLLIGVTVIILGKWILMREFLPHTPIDAAIALLIIWAFLGILAANGLATGATKITGLVFGIVSFYFLTGALRSTSRIGIAIAIFVSMGMAVSLIGTVSRQDGAGIAQIDNNRIFKIIPRTVIKFERAETGINPNPLAGTTLLFIPSGMMVFAFLIKKKKMTVKRTPLDIAKPLAIAGMLSLIGLEFFAVVFSRSSGALVALAFILLMMGKRARFLKACLGVAVLLAFFFIMKSPDLNKNAIVRNTRESLNVSASIRLPLWKGGLEASRAHPSIGLGMDRFRTMPPFNYVDAHAHNQFIHLAAEMGIPALIAYIAILIGTGWMTLEVVRSKMPEGLAMMMRGLAWGQIGLAIFGIADAIPLGAKPGIFFWISLAIMTSIYLYGKNRSLLRGAEKLIES